MDKNKIIEAAAKLVAKGAYDKAIKEYQKVLDADPKDVRVLQKMGELFQKKNDNVQAAQYFIKVAESYSSDGFFLKAVALYKQVLKLNPALIEVNLKLAELHQQLQLMSEAMAYYQLVANHYDKSGDVKASLDTLKKMVDLDPDNVASRIKLAELYARENMNKEATVEFKRSAEYLKRNNRTDDYLRVAERLSALQPDDLPLAKELALQYVQRQDHKRALAKLQVAFKADPRDIETLNLLAQAFGGLGQTSKTLSVYKELAKVYSEKNRNDESNKIWAKVAQLDPNDPDVLARQQANRPQQPAQNPQPHHQPQQQQQMRNQPAGAPPAGAPPPGNNAPPPGPPVAAAQPKPAASAANAALSKLLTETDVYVKYGLHDKALEHLRKIFAADPENLDAHEKAYHIYLGANNQAQAAEQLLNVLRLMTRRADVQRAQPYLAALLQTNPGHPEVSAFLAVLRSANGGMDAAPVEEEVIQPEVPDDAILVDSTDEEIIVADAPEDALAGQTVEDLEPEAIEEEVIAEPEPELVASEEIEEPSQDFITDEPLVDSTSDEDAFAAASDELVVEEDQVLDEPQTTENSAPLDDFEPQTLTNNRRPQVTSQDDELVTAGSAPVLEEDEPATGEHAAFEEPVEQTPEAPAEDDPAAEESDEASFFLDQGLTEEAREILETVLIAYPGNARAAELMTRLEELEAAGGSAQAAEEAPPAEEIQPPSVETVSEEEAQAVASEATDGGERDAFDLAAELADELGEMGEEAAPEPEAPQGDDFQISVDQVFSEFKKGLEKVVKPEDVETHYDLGIAYKEMGLIDDGINEFKVAREGCRGKKKEVDCLSMMAQLQDMKGDSAGVIATLKEALGSEHSVGEAEKSLRYDIGIAYEKAGQKGKALFHFQKVHAVDPKYRDIVEIIKRLGGVKPEEDVIAKSAGGKPPPTGTNGSHGPGPKGGGTPPKSGGTPPASASDTAGKTRKVGYV